MATLINPKQTADCFSDLTWGRAEMATRINPKQTAENKAAVAAIDKQMRAAKTGTVTPKASASGQAAAPVAVQVEVSDGGRAAELRTLAGQLRLKGFAPADAADAANADPKATELRALAAKMGLKGFTDRGDKA